MSARLQIEEGNRDGPGRALQLILALQLYSKLRRLQVRS